MITYLIKVILCSALLLLVYHLLFEKEKMHRFNRFYLLSSIAVPFILPLIQFHAVQTTIPILETSHLNEIVFVGSDEPHALMNGATKNPINYWPFILLGIYIMVSLLLMYRFTSSVLKIVYKIKAHPTTQLQNATIVLTKDDLIPHSFLSYIFIDEIAFQNNQIEKEILTHELSHVQQRHSLDILLIEFVQMFFWFNPVLIGIKKAIKLNHEFLADESVVAAYANPNFYQQLMIQKITQVSQHKLASPFNFLITKKRIFMITKTSSRAMLLMKQCIALSLFVLCLFVFCEKSFAQVKTDTSSNTLQKKQIQAKSTIQYGDGASQALLDEYDSTLKGMMKPAKTASGRKINTIDMRKCDPDRMTYIYELMNKEQRDKRTILSGVVWKSLATTPTKRIPSEEDMFAWTKEKKYGVWVDGKRIKNNELKKYQTNDFALFYISKLEKNAINYGDHFYQVDLYTTAYYETNLVKKRK